MKKDAKFAEAVRAIGLSADVRQFADERLLDACDRFNDLWLESERLWRLNRRDYAAFRKGTCDERDALLREIINTPARTNMGRDAKGNVTLHFIQGMGKFAALVESALGDFMCFDPRRHREAVAPPVAKAKRQR